MTPGIVQPVYPSRRPATARQRQLFDFIAAEILTKQRSPSFREMGRVMGCTSTKAITDFLDALLRKGWIVRDPGKSRAVSIRRYEGEP